MDTQKLVEILDNFPELKKSVERMISVARNIDGKIELADDAEAILLKEGPKLSKATLQAWAELQSQTKTQEFKKRHKKVRKDVKKN